MDEDNLVAKLVKAVILLVVIGGIAFFIFIWVALSTMHI